MNTLAKIIKILVYGAVILAGVTFAVSNRGIVELTFYPVPYVISMPLFLFFILTFAIGAALGWGIARLKVGGYRRAHRQAVERIEALENELGTLRTRQTVRPATALPQQ